MNFTREPIIETVITPREGCKLLVKSSKTAGQEEYQVEALEVVSFGRALFYRSQERPKPFLVPVTDYEVIESKEVRMPIKNAPQERSIKIGGGREAPVRPAREPQVAEERYPAEEATPEAAEPVQPQQQQQRMGDKKRDRRRSRRRRALERHEAQAQEMQPRATESPAPLMEEAPEEGGKKSEEPPAPSFISRLFPPPPTLIRDTISRYKTPDGEVKPPEETFFEKPDLDEEEPPSFED